MTQYMVTFQPQGLSVSVDAGCNLLQAQILAGLRPDAPCGGKGTCGKCRVILEGREVLACQTTVDRDMTIFTKEKSDARILTEGLAVAIRPDGTDDYVLAFDIGTTTVVAYLLDGHTGTLLAQGSCVNPQGQYGADVISRVQQVLEEGGQRMADCIRKAMHQLAQDTADRAGIPLEKITASAIVGNTAMHHLLLNINPQPLVIPPYMPKASQAIERNGARILPNIAGFVGGDTVGCMVATRFDQLEELTLLIDIGTNGEMVLGDRNRRIACSTAAGPAFEGAKISCGMRGADGAVDHVWLEDGKLVWHVIGDGEAVGLCGSGLLDLVSCLLETGAITERGRMPAKEYRLGDTAVVLTQKDVREVQLAKGAIRAGIDLMCEYLGIQVEQIETVYLAGAFGNYLDPAAACRIGMIPPCLQDRIQPIGNAAGEGAVLSALSKAEFDYASTLGTGTEFLELASLRQFQDRFIWCLNF